MKMQDNSHIITMSEEFDRMLLAILSTELNTLKTTRSNSITKFTPDVNTDLLVA
ncbi:hypothetical protein [Pararcticibacter amylolyticus]|uniref:hypothetical protein n=1 Tax=Pararcticibacter amylolyticus TaxID=2173175 RepID=UPI001304EA08|nr:hypothetical protein [Pararcticibacter amylolyticus]